MKLEVGEWNAAAEQFEHALAHQALLAEARLGKAAVPARRGKTAEAEQLLLSLLERRSIAMRTRYELGRICTARGELAKASAYFQDALSIIFPEPKSPPANRKP